MNLVVLFLGQINSEITTNIVEKLFNYTLAEVILISVRSLQRNEGDVSDHIKYILVCSCSV